MRKQHRTQQRDDPSTMNLPLPCNFVIIIVAGHLKLNSRDEAVGARSYALGIMDRYTGWTHGFSSVGKSIETNRAVFRQFATFLNKIQNFWTDNAFEFVNTCKILGYRHHPSTENRSQSNGIAQRSIRRILEGT